MLRSEEYMSERYSNLEMDEIREDMKEALELLYEEYGNINIEVSYTELNHDRVRVRRDLMWTLKELITSYGVDHDFLYFTDLEMPCEEFPIAFIQYESAWEQENIEFDNVD